ncbi:MULTISPECIES: hypothetical protein [unclassified Microcoleus]
MMIADHFVAMGYTGTLCFSVCKDEPSEDDAKRIFFDVSLTLSQLSQLRDAINAYLCYQSKYSLASDRFPQNESSEN